MSDGRYVVLLRGVNVGGSNKLPMKSLAALVEACGAQEVRTYIQSGNVVLRATPAVVKTLPARIEAAILEQHGFNAPTVMRSGAALQKILEENPYTKEGVEEEAQLILFLRERRSKQAVATLDPGRWLPDRFVVAGQEVYAHYPQGIGKSKMTNAYFDSRLNTLSTGRNLRTLRQLLAMCAE